MERLSDICEMNIVTKEDSFVGLTYEAGMPKIIFPMGFRITRDNDVELRREICLLLSCIQNNNCSKLFDEQGIVNSKLETSGTFPFVAYKSLIEDYIRNGLIHNKQKKYIVDTKGKINWKKTIKQITPSVQDSSFVYSKFIVEKNAIKENALITNIHKYCVYESCAKIGWLFNGIQVERPKMLIDVRYFIGAIKKAMNETFIDEKRKLFQNMIDVLKGLDDSVENKKEYKVGTNHFEYLWEYMIDRKFGVQDKARYFPHAKWFIRGMESNRAPLELDTLFFTEDRAFVIDAKYYKYGTTKLVNDLPATATIAKQVIYGEYVGRKSKLPVSNAFVMPYNGGHLMKCGYAKVDWMDDDNEYNNVLLILYDTKKMMREYMSSNIKDKQALVDIILLDHII